MNEAEIKQVVQAVSEALHLKVDWQPVTLDPERAKHGAVGYTGTSTRDPRQGMAGVLAAVFGDVWTFLVIGWPEHEDHAAGFDGTAINSRRGLMYRFTPEQAQEAFALALAACAARAGVSA